MSTNPFRQISIQQEEPGSSTNAPSTSQPVWSDGGNPRNIELSLDTRVPSSFDRHVSFASPAVDSTIPAASYPSSPESTRFSPPWQGALPTTPNYRTAFQHDPFQDLGQDRREDSTLQEALTNAQNNAAAGQNTAIGAPHDAVRDTLSRFAATSPRPLPPPGPQAAEAARKSLDVEAFKRLLLTGDSSSMASATKQGDLSSGTDTTSLSQQSTTDSLERATDDTPRSSHEHERLEDARGEPAGKIPPPAPAPRRGKSVKERSRISAADEGPTIRPDAISAVSVDRPTRKAPTPPDSRRHSQQASSIKREDAVITTSGASSPTESLHTAQKAPPPPPMRRQHSISHRRPSNDLATTIEEPGTDDAQPAVSRRSSSDRPQPPISRNSSLAFKRQSLGHMISPPLPPPPRRGQGSSRSSMDGFRPSLSTMLGNGADEENLAPNADIKDLRQSKSSNAESILAELANLQREVDAARRSG